jgi:hypothetical protein
VWKKFTDVSEVLVASIIRAMNKPLLAQLLLLCLCTTATSTTTFFALDFSHHLFFKSFKNLKTIKITAAMRKLYPVRGYLKVAYAWFKLSVSVPVIQYEVTKLGFL